MAWHGMVGAAGCCRAPHSLIFRPPPPASAHLLTTLCPAPPHLRPSPPQLQGRDRAGAQAAVVGQLPGHGGGGLRGGAGRPPGGHPTRVRGHMVQVNLSGGWGRVGAGQGRAGQTPNRRGGLDTLLVCVCQTLPPDATPPTDTPTHPPTLPPAAAGGWRTSATGACRGSCGGATASPPSTSSWRVGGLLPLPLLPLPLLLPPLPPLPLPLPLLLPACVQPLCPDCDRCCFGHRLGLPATPTQLKPHHHSQPARTPAAPAPALACASLLQTRRRGLAATRAPPASTWTAGWWAGTRARRWRRRSSASPAGQSSWCRWAVGDAAGAGCSAAIQAAWLPLSAVCIPAFMPSSIAKTCTHSQPCGGSGGPACGPAPFDRCAGMPCMLGATPEPQPGLSGRHDAF